MRSELVWRITFLLIVAIGACNPAIGQPKQIFEITEIDGAFHFQIKDEGSTILSEPAEGLWSIGLGWDNNWIKEWKNVSPKHFEISGPNHILAGEIEIGGELLSLRDAYSMVKPGVVKCTRRFHWRGEDTLREVTLSVRFSLKSKAVMPFLPGINYYGNPSGARSGNVPVFGNQEGEYHLFEEHRFPMPFAMLEKQGEDGVTSVALHSLPSLVPYANKQDQWWSLGLKGGRKTTELVALSGPTASNGMKSVIKAFQEGDIWAPYNDAFLNIAPGGIVEKTFYIEVTNGSEKGNSFTGPVHTSIDLFQPVELKTFPPIKDILASKYRFAESRWIEEGKVSGFNQFDNALKKYLVLGWVGQAAAPGYAFQVLQDDVGKPSEVMEMAQKSLDFISDIKMREDGKGFYTWYSVDDQKWVERIWKPMPEILSQGQAMNNMANAINASKKSGLDPQKWKSFLKKASDFHAQRILSLEWKPESTNEGFFIAPLCKASQILNEDKYLQAALKAGDHYYNRHFNMEEPYWGGTLDASCEDKEGAYAAFQGFLELFETTGDEKFLEAARHACDVVLSYTYVWDVDMPAGRLRDHAFKTSGWTAVSVQNMHIDVYGVLMTPEIYRLGQITEDEQLKELALLMYRSCGQLIDPYGSQGEQPQQTNYSQAHVEGKNPLQFRGGYIEDWTVFWITAHFLNGAAGLKELGVEIE